MFDVSQYDPPIISIPVHVTTDNTVRFPSIECAPGTGYRLRECIVRIRDAFRALHKYIKFVLNRNLRLFSCNHISLSLFYLLSNTSCCSVSNSGAPRSTGIDTSTLL